MNTQLEPSTLKNDEIITEDAVVVMPEEVAPPSVCTPKPKKKRFFLGLCIYFVILLVLSGGALLGLYNMLTEYEASTPNAPLNQYAEWIKSKNYTAIYEAGGFEETPLNPKSAYLSYFESIYANAPEEIAFRERATTDDNKKQFSVYFGDTRVSILDLTKTEIDGKIRWAVIPQVVYQNDYVIYADADARITVNGSDISLLGITPVDAKEKLFFGLNKLDNCPSVVSYTLSGLLTSPSIEALTLSGEVCTVVQDEADPQVFRIMAVPSEETIAEQETFAKNAALTYAKFIARDASRNSLLALIHKDAMLYNAVRNFSNVWFPKHESYSFEDIRLHSSVRYTDDDFTCEVQFQPYYVKDGKSYADELAHYRMTFMNIDGEWKMTLLTPVVQSGTSSSTTTTTNTTTTATATTTATTVA